MSNLIFDIEAIRDPEIPIDEERLADPKFFPPPAAWQIYCLAAYDDDGFHLLSGDERTILEGFKELWGTGKRLVTWNGRGFDCPVITMRSLRHGVAIPRYFKERDVRYRYTTRGHFDVMDHLADYGATKSPSLDHAARLVGLPGKAGDGGADVARMVAEGRSEDVYAYCLSDVFQLAVIFYRVQVLAGMSPKGALDKILKVYEDAAKTPLLEGFLRTLQGSRFLSDAGLHPHDENAKKAEPEPLAEGWEFLVGKPCRQVWAGRCVLGEQAYDLRKQDSAFFHLLEALTHSCETTYAGAKIARGENVCREQCRGSGAGLLTDKEIQANVDAHFRQGNSAASVDGGKVSIRMTMKGFDLEPAGAEWATNPEGKP